MKFIQSIVAWLSARPAVKNLIEGLFHAVIGAAIAYVGPVLVPGGDITTLHWSGLAWAILGAVKAFQQNQHDKILALLQDQMQAMISQVPPNAPVNSIVAPTSSVLTPTSAVPVVPCPNCGK